MQPDFTLTEPVTIAPAQPCKARVISHAQINSGYYRLKLRCLFIAAHAQPGQFIHVLPPHVGFDPLLRRAFSILNVDNEAIEILYRAAGKGTTLLSSVVPGQTIDLLGPLGRPFHIGQGDVILVGGGVGVPPLVFLAQHLRTRLALREQSDKNRPFSLTAMIGGRTRYDVIGESELRSLQVDVQVATDDGSAGHQGLVTDLLRRHLETRATQPVGEDKSELPIVYSCGPFPMLRAVARLCAEFNVLCQVSLEENMPCGIGVCNGCVVPVVQAGDDYGLFRRICVEGPVLWSHEVDWTHSVGH